MGCLTMVMAGLAALGEMDIKKIVALSTLRQLGVIMATIGAGLPTLGFFHLLSHAYFKALLFITIGAMIHISRDYQDLRKVSLLPSISPSTFSFSVVANLSLCGIPFTRGFYSKDACIEGALGSYLRASLIVIFIVATALTSRYTARLLVYLGLSVNWTNPLIWSNDRDNFILGAKVMLAPLALAGGRFLS